MKSLMLFVLLISMVALNHGVQTNKKFLHPGVVDPCQRPGGPHPGCLPKDNKASQTVPGESTPANAYQRGCSKLNRCRSL